MKNLGLSAMVRVMHFLYLFFAGHIWTVIYHQIFTMHIQALNSQDLLERLHKAMSLSDFAIVSQKEWRNKESNIDPWWL